MYKNVFDLGFQLLCTELNSAKSDFKVKILAIFRCYQNKFIAMQKILPHKNMGRNLHYRESPTSTNSISTIFSTIGIKFILVEFLELAM